MALHLVTGAAGFIGSHLCARLLEEGEEVLGVDCFTDYYDPALKRRNLATLQGRPGFRFRELDLRAGAIEPVLDRVEGIFHQAAQAGVRASWGEHFRDYSDINVLATQRLLEACRGREEQIRRFVYASSSSIYGDALAYPVGEDDPKLPISPYGVTKLAGELLVRLYAVQHGLRATSLRYFTVYGPRQRPDMGFHRFLRAIHEGRSVPLYGDGEQTRDFTFVSDAVEANLLALRGDRVEPGTAFNIGGGSRVRLLDVLDRLAAITGKPVRIDRQPPSPGDVRHTGADTARAREQLGYAPKVGIDEGLRRENEWMIRYLAGDGE